MIARHIPSALLVAALAACAAVGQLTVKDYTAASGQRVRAGQVEPKAEYGCRKIATESEPWGMSGNMNRAEAGTRLTATAVNKAPGKGANYAFVNPPSETSIGGFNVKAFSDAEVTYYACSRLPAMQ